MPDMSHPHIFCPSCGDVIFMECTASHHVHQSEAGVLLSVTVSEDAQVNIERAGRTRSSLEIVCAAHQVMLHVASLPVGNRHTAGCN